MKKLTKTIPPKRGPKPQGLKKKSKKKYKGDVLPKGSYEQYNKYPEEFFVPYAPSEIKNSTVRMKNGGCPFRENGVKSDIKGISNIQIKGKKFIGTK